jgi:hypothetical protein
MSDDEDFSESSDSDEENSSEETHDSDSDDSEDASSDEEKNSSNEESSSNEEEEKDENKKKVEQKNDITISSSSMKGVTISKNGIHINDLKNTCVEIVDVGMEKSSLIIKNIENPKNLLYVEINEKNGCTINFKTPLSSTVSNPPFISQQFNSPSSSPINPYTSPSLPIVEIPSPQPPISYTSPSTELKFTRPSPPSSFQFDKSRNISTQMAELLHTGTFFF